MARVLEFISFLQLPVWHCLIPIDVCLPIESFNVPHFIFQQRISHCPGFLGDSVVKQQQQQQQLQTLPTIARDVISILGREDSPGRGNGNPLPYPYLGEIPWTEEPGGLQSMGLQSQT